MRYEWTSLAIAFGIALAVGGLEVGMTVGAERRLRRWAEANGLTILKVRRAMFCRGPFTWTAARTDFVYRLTVLGPKGEVLEGWARSRGWWCIPCGARSRRGGSVGHTPPRPLATGRM